MTNFNCNDLRITFNKSEQIEVDLISNENSILEFSVKLKGTEAIVPDKYEMDFSIDLVDIHSIWMPSTGYNHGLTTNYYPLQSCISVNSPVVSLMSNNNDNKLTLSYSDSINLVKISGAVCEETCSWDGKIILFDGISDKISEYSHVLRVDMRDIQFYQAIKDVAAWWESFSYLNPAEIVEVSKFPMYSTWYSFHQQVTSENMLEQSEVATKLGCSAIIIDDGWQTLDGSRGYAYCGDWEVCKEKIPDMAKLVEDMHQIDTKVLLWYCVPLIGYKSKKWEELKTMLLKQDYNSQGCGILDPRYKVVREYIISTYENAVKNWNLDGLKLDFIDCFKLYDETPRELKDGMDYLSVSDATYNLFVEMMSRLKKIKEDIMIEFRQSYTGPTMRVYGNIFRAVDCPTDPFINRVRVLDLRLTSGNTVVHSDMIRWNEKDSDRSVAYQLWSTIFSVPQISVDLTKLSTSHSDIVKNFLTFTRENVDILMEKNIKLFHPETAYSSAQTENHSTACLAIYQENYVKMPSKNAVFVVNASYGEVLFMDFSEIEDEYSFKIVDLMGNVIENSKISANETIHSFNFKTGDRIEFAKI